MNRRLITLLNDSIYIIVIYDFFLEKLDSRSETKIEWRINVVWKWIIDKHHMTEFRIPKMQLSARFSKPEYSVYWGNAIWAIHHNIFDMKKNVVPKPELFSTTKLHTV